MIYFGGGYPALWFWSPPWLPDYTAPPTSEGVPLALTVPMRVVLAVERPVTMASAWALALGIVTRVRLKPRGLSVLAQIPARVTRQVRVVAQMRGAVVPLPVATTVEQSPAVLQTATTIPMQLGPSVSVPLAVAPTIGVPMQITTTATVQRKGA